ncbi:EamA family transporter [Phocaeicola coprophilus]
MRTNSFEKNKKGIFLMIISSIVVCLGQLLWKLGSNGDITLLGGGFLLYGLGALLMITAYKFGSLSVLQPILSLNYVISLFVGYYFLNESVSIQNLLGVIIIILGVYLIATGD